MEGGRESDGGVGSKSSLTWACRRPCPFMRAGRRSRVVVSCVVVFVRVCSVFVCVHAVFVHVRSFPFVGVRRCLWAFISVSGHASSSMGVRLRSFSFMGGRLCLCACVSVSWCAVGR